MLAGRVRCRSADVMGVEQAVVSPAAILTLRRPLTQTGRPPRLQFGRERQVTGTKLRGMTRPRAVIPGCPLLDHRVRVRTGLDPRPPPVFHPPTLARCWRCGQRVVGRLRVYSRRYDFGIRKNERYGISALLDSEGPRLSNQRGDTHPCLSERLRVGDGSRGVPAG